MKTSYQVVSKEDRAKLAEFLAKEGQQLLPLVDLVEQSRLAVDEMVDVMGQAVVEAVLSLSAISVAGERHQGKAGGDSPRKRSPAGGSLTVAAAGSSRTFLPPIFWSRLSGPAAVTSPKPRTSSASTATPSAGGCSGMRCIASSSLNERAHRSRVTQDLQEVIFSPRKPGRGLVVKACLDLRPRKRKKEGAMDSKVIGHKVRELRRRMGLTTVTLAKKVRLSQAQVSRLEIGLQGFRSATLIKFARVLGVPPSSFFVAGEDASTGRVAKEMETLGLAPSKTLRKAMTRPAFFKFAEKCAKAARTHRKNLVRMEAALRRI